MATPLELIQLSFQNHLRQMAEELPPDYQLTLVVRNTKMPNADIIMTRDSLPEVAEAILSLAK